ncbi:MAG TPA: hypothetical protein VK092_04300, partial [Deinococcales bacterium]|nr:hypothetical protein [Deinococcales bacterium]
RRIFEATEAEEAARRQQAAPDRTGLPPPAAPVAPAGPARKPQRTQVDAAAAHTRAAAARTRRLREEKTGELQVTRLPRRETYTGRRRSITASSLLTRDSVLKGLVWHQILSEPPHRRAGRRQQSRPRSR